MNIGQITAGDLIWECPRTSQLYTPPPGKWWFVYSAETSFSTLIKILAWDMQTQTKHCLFHCTQDVSLSGLVRYNFFKNGERVT